MGSSLNLLIKQNLLDHGALGQLVRLAKHIGQDEVRLCLNLNRNNIELRIICVISI